VASAQRVTREPVGHADILGRIRSFFGLGEAP
jgi:hypothetical protein